jgi:anaerobic selenocysteine-containing dehydrogenase/Fe-S-cluster-containing dehydrogenase component
MSEGIKRRDFLKVLGVSGAGAGMVGCSTDQVEKLIPYVIPPEEITPGVATWYSTVCGECPAACGVWVRTREGRAVKVEGNPHHPVSGGALCSRGHASLQGLYNPDRLAGPMRRDEDGEFQPIAWDEAEALLADRVQDAGADFVLVTRKEGPALGGLIEAVVEAVGGTRVEYEALSEAPLREATRMAFGQDAVPTFRFDEADLIFSFGADFLETWLSPVEHARGFARSTGVDEAHEKARFVFLSSRLSLTGQNADEWVPLRAGSEGVVALAIAHALVQRGADAGPYSDLIQAYDAQAAAAEAGIPAETIEELADAFQAAEAPLAVGPGVAGQGANATATNLAVLILNAVAGSVGRTLHVTRSDLAAPATPYRELADVIARMAEGQVSTLVLNNVNPAYSLPPGAGFREALGQVGFSVAITPQLDETAALCDLVLPDAHPLESWGDAHPRPGLWAIRQPVMQPVPHFDSRSSGDVLVRLVGRLGQDLGAETFHDYLRSRWSDLHAELGSPGGTFEAFWREALRAGVVEVDAAAAQATAMQAPDRALTFDTPELDGEGMALIVYPSPRFGDGRGANKPWLQELPDPVSKLAWHSWVEVHPDTAEELGIRRGDMVRVSSPHGELEVPVYTYPGIRADTVAIAMGGGHENFGRFADGNGVNPMTLLPAAVEEPSGALAHLSVRVNLEPTGRRYRMASIEGSDQQYDRPIAPAVQLADLREGNIEPAGGYPTRQELQAMGGFVPITTDAEPQDFPLPGARYGDYDPETNPRWAMAIDLDKCTGCSACVTACQVENNVASVGEDQLAMGRDLHWIRMERYYEQIDASQPGPVDIRFLPMLCQHCGNAPCEPVCPVYAAYHTPDGINAQVYNRCVGTRYCANNCPYKVRVFNWHRFSEVPEPLNWQYNPDVTVRTEGIMEKCTFCVQRIRQTENQATLEGRTVGSDEVVPACQQSCPAEAIVFGNIRDPESRVYQVSNNDRTYRVLDVLINTQPAVNYLRKVTFHPVESIHV